MGGAFTLRWAARDLRRRWAQVLAIALIIGIGTGVYAGLGSTAEWRRRSNDESFAMLHMYDMHDISHLGEQVQLNCWVTAISP